MALLKNDVTINVLVREEEPVLRVCSILERIVYCALVTAAIYSERIVEFEFEIVICSCEVHVASPPWTMNVYPV
jgi:hypothetical protein